ncbi:TGF_BETA_2 domain-containing protein, partial [Nephila pilipes]
LSVEESGDQKPFIVANLNPAAAERKRRSTNNGSDKNCTCCLVDFYVSFKELDWPWVVAPLGFNANMCYGKCNYQLNSYPSHYHRMLSTILNNKTTSVENKEDLWTPCCSPTKLKPLDMIYVASNTTNTNSSFIFHKIPDMITESCGCW